MRRQAGIHEGEGEKREAFRTRLERSSRMQLETTCFESYITKLQVTTVVDSYVGNIFPTTTNFWFSILIKMISKLLLENHCYISFHP